MPVTGDPLAVRVGSHSLRSQTYKAGMKIGGLMSPAHKEADKNDDDCVCVCVCARPRIGSHNGPLGAEVTYMMGVAWMRGWKSSTQLDRHHG